MAEATVLAKELARRKEKDLKQIAEELNKRICELAELTYRESSIVFNFDAGFFKTSPIKMTIPKDISKKQKKAKKQNKASSVKMIEDSKIPKQQDNMDIRGLTQAELLYVYIVNTFNNIETTVSSQTGKSREQEIILSELKDLLQQQSFVVEIDDSYMRINWW